MGTNRYIFRKKVPCLRSLISILNLYHKFAGSNIGEYRVSPVIGPLSASYFAPRIADTGCGQ